MSTLKEYKDYFKPEEVPDALVNLIEFDGKHEGFFSQGFEIDCSYFDGVGLKTYSEDPEFLKCFREIAQADGTGSTYAIWRQSGALADAPIVAFGSEGGVHIVAKNLLELFRILTLDAEPMIDFDKVTYYKSEDDEASSGAADYVKWLAKTFKLKPVTGMKEVEQIVKDAQKSHEKAFQNWMKQYYGA